MIKNPDEKLASKSERRNRGNYTSYVVTQSLQANSDEGGVFQSGQMGQTVNLLSFDFGGSNPSAPTFTDAES